MKDIESRRDELIEELEKEKSRIKRTRKNRIHLSERLKKYDHKWNMIIFLLNMEAVILIITVISSYSTSFSSVFSGLFSAYVILLQYFINEQKYSERSLKVHYHQLELSDNLDELNHLILKVKHKENLKEMDLYKTLSNKKGLLKKYQLSLNIASDLYQPCGRFDQ